MSFSDAMKITDRTLEHNPDVKCTSSCKAWVGPMHSCRFKYPVFIQGEGYTSSKQRILACGSMPMFLDHDEHDSYYDRWLTPNFHYRVLNKTRVCTDLAQNVWWVWLG